LCFILKNTKTLLHPEKGCATMINTDPASLVLGFMYYPKKEFNGYRVKPADFFYRPWQLYHRLNRFSSNEESRFCFADVPYFKTQLELVEQFATKLVSFDTSLNLNLCHDIIFGCRFSQHCHFSFNFVTDFSHDSPFMLEHADPVLQPILKRLNRNPKVLNHTVLIVMGDHGNRISKIHSTFVGEIEERAPFLSIFFPHWFKKKHPKLMENLR